MGNILIYVSTGGELDTFKKCENLWKIFAKLNPDIKIYFVSNCPKIKENDLILDGNELRIGIPSFYKNLGPLDYSKTGVWNPLENKLQINRHIRALSFFSEMHGSKVNWIYHSTVTSIINFKMLDQLERILKDRCCFAGMLGRLTNNTKYVGGLCFVCGTNTIFSMDTAKTLISRYKKSPDKYAYFPNDIWHSLLLYDFDRTLIPFFSFTNTIVSQVDHETLINKIRKVVNQGHIHFRFKLDTRDDKIRALNDSVMMQILIGELEAKKADQSFPESFNQMILEFKESFPKLDTFNIPAWLPRDQFFSGPRRVSLNDSEI